MGEWFEEQAFWEAYASLMFDGERWAEVPAVCDAIERLSGVARGAAVLDSCCGPGRHSLEFARRGYAVTGVDLTASYLEAARESAAAEGLAPEFLRADIRGFRRTAAFDLALNLYTSFGYFATPEEDLGMLRNLRDSLRPGGALVLETLGKEIAVRDFTEGEWFERDGWTVLTAFRVVGAWEGLENRWILLRDGERIDRSFVRRLYSAVELRAALLAAGFSSVQLFGSVEGSPYDREASSLVALARA